MSNMCYLPFHDLYYEEVYNGEQDDIGQYRTCCIQKDASFPGKNIFKNGQDWFKNDPNLIEIRKQFLKGRWPDSCERCVLLESKGLKSYRHYLSEYYHRNNFPIPTSLEDAQLKTIDVRLSNKCNLMCRMCSVEFSNQHVKHQQEAKDKGIYAIHGDRLDDLNRLAKQENSIRQSDGEMLEDLVKFLIENDSVYKIKLAGGEPMIMPEIEKFINDLLDAGKHDLNLFFLTNATTIKPKLIEKLKKFQSVELSCSVDGVGKWIEYQRWPCKWEQIKSNVETLLQSGLHVTLTPCWSHLNLFALPHFIDWVNELENLYFVAANMVNYPTYLAWELIPIKYREPLLDQLSQKKFANEFIQSHYQTFINQIPHIVRSITAKERKSLANEVRLWDYKNPIPYRDRYEWANDLLG